MRNSRKQTPQKFEFATIRTFDSESQRPSNLIGTRTAENRKVNNYFRLLDAATQRLPVMFRGSRRPWSCIEGIGRRFLRWDCGKETRISTNNFYPITLEAFLYKQIV